MSLKIQKNENSFISDNAKRFTLRMDSNLFEDISTFAKIHKRSVSKEIEYAIQLYVLNLQEKYWNEEDVNNPNYY